MGDLTITGVDGETLAGLYRLATEQDTTVEALVHAIIAREVRRRRGRSLASLVLLFGPIVVLVLLIVFGD